MKNPTGVTVNKAVLDRLTPWRAREPPDKKFELFETRKVRWDEKLVYVFEDIPPRSATGLEEYDSNDHFLYLGIDELFHDEREIRGTYGAERHFEGKKFRAAM